MSDPQRMGATTPLALPFTKSHLNHVRITVFGRSSQVGLPHEGLHPLWTLKEMVPLLPETL